MLTGHLWILILFLKLNYLSFHYWVSKFSLYILDTAPLSDTWFQLFFPSWGLFSIFLRVANVDKQVQFFNFYFSASGFNVVFGTPLKPRSWRFAPMFSSVSFTVLVSCIYFCDPVWVNFCAPLGPPSLFACEVSSCACTDDWKGYCFPQWMD